MRYVVKTKKENNVVKIDARPNPYDKRKMVYLLKADNGETMQVDKDWLVKHIDEIDNVGLSGNSLYVVNKQTNKAEKKENIDESVESILEDARKRILNAENNENLARYEKVVRAVKNIQSKKNEIQKAIKDGIAVDAFCINTQKFNSSYMHYRTDKKTTLRTDCWFHSLGLYGNLGKLYTTQGKYYEACASEYLGNAAGGACGSFDFYTNGVEVSCFTDKSGKIVPIETYVAMVKAGKISWVESCLLRFDTNFEDYMSRLNYWLEKIKA